MKRRFLKLDCRVRPPAKAHSSHFWQVSWLSLHRAGRLPDRYESLHSKRLNFTVSGFLASPPRSQWRGRAGFSPASLLSFYKAPKANCSSWIRRAEKKVKARSRCL